MTRDILDYQGNVVGELDLPDDTSEAVWAEKLAVYARPPTIQVSPDVTPRQIRQALILSGMTLAQIDAAIAGLPEPTRSLAQVEWEYSIAFQRNRPLVIAMASMLGWSSAQVDALWKLAASL